MGKIIVTGGAGFIGTHLCTSLLSSGHDVICIDNFLSGSRDNLVSFIDNPHFTLLEHDVCQPLPPNAILHKIDAIFHFACPASPNPSSPISYMRFPVETMMVNTLGTQRMLELAQTHKSQIIFASTSEVYGDPLVHPQPETYWGNVSPNGPRSCYDEGKRAGEALSFAYYRHGDVQLKVIRIFNTYGPHMRLDDGRFTINLIDSHINKKPFKMYGNGEFTRSFCYINDLIDGIIKVYQSKDAIGQVINLGNPKELKLNQAIKIFEQVSGKKLNTITMASQQDDPKRRCPDITLAKQILGWEPKIDFSTGIKQTLDYYEKA